MGDFLEYVFMGVIAVVAWVVAAAIALACLGLPIYFAIAHHDPHYLFWYAVSLPVFGALVGGIMWIEDN